MEQEQFIVRGENAWTVPQAIQGYPKGKRVDYDGDGFAVVVTEQYYMRGGCHIQTTTIFELIDDNSVKVTLVEGGGREAWVHRGLRVKSAELSRVAEKIEDYCRENGLEIERD